MPEPQRGQELTLRQQHNLRAKIAEHGSLIITRFVGAVRGDVVLTPTQVRAGSILLNKILPDLQSVDMQTRGTGGVSITITQYGAPEKAERVTVEGDSGEQRSPDSVEHTQPASVDQPSPSPSRTGDR